jgi:hypothetical protein
LSTRLSSTFPPFISRSKNNFKYKEEESPALLLHLPKLFAETAVLVSASGLGCCLVVASPQARADKIAAF